MVGMFEKSRGQHSWRAIRRRIAGASFLAGGMWLAGCHSLDMSRRETHVEQASLEHYVDRAVSVASPDLTTEAPENIATLPPHTIADRSRDAIREISLAESIHLCLAHSEIIRERGQFLSPSNSLLTSPGLSPSIYDPAIQETDTGYGRRGVEAALADFDTMFTAQMLWGRDEQIQNSLFGYGQTPGETLKQDTARFQSRLEKPFATGSTFAVNHNVDYGYNNAMNRLFPSAYQGNVEAEFRHPLLAGSGVEFNRIAGPQSRSLGRGAQFTNGVLIARINSDIEVAQFERAARNLVREVEEAYWNLTLAYRVYHAEVVARDSTLQTWRLVKSRQEKGLPGGAIADLAQAEDGYLEARARSESARADLYRKELELRRLTGLPVNDGTVLRTCDEPTTTEFIPDWYTALCHALTSRSELRQQKWEIKSLELQLKAAKNYARPSLDFVSRYRVNGFGDRLTSGSDNDEAGTEQGLNSFYGNIAQGDQTGWDLGVELSMPVGLRAAKSQVRWYELRLAKARAALGMMEHEISHELAAAFQDLERYYKTAQTNWNRRRAAEERVRAFETRYEHGGVGETGGSRTAYLDLLLRSQISLAQAEVAYWQSIVAYNQAIADIHLREGTLLERSGVMLAEGSWSPAAYEQALAEAWRRSRAIHNPLLETEPEDFALDGRVVPTSVPFFDEEAVWLTSGMESGEPTPTVPPAPSAPPERSVPAAPTEAPVPKKAPALPRIPEVPRVPKVSEAVVPTVRRDVLEKQDSWVAARGAPAPVAPVKEVRVEMPEVGVSPEMASKRDGWRARGPVGDGAEDGESAQGKWRAASRGK